MKFLQILAVVILAESLVVIWAVMQNETNVGALQTVTRLSGRVSLLMFSFIFLLYPAKVKLLERILSPKYLLLFALHHGFHLAVLLAYVYLAGIELVPYRVAGGFFAYLLIFLMPWLQERTRTGKLAESAFDRVLGFYQYYVWFIFFMTYVARINRSFPNAGGTYEEHVILMSWVCVAVVVKVIFSKRG